MRPLVVTGRHRPHEVALLVCSAVLGVAYLAGAPTPPSVQVLQPVWLRDVWYWLLIAGGAVGAAGLWVRRVDLGMGLERAGMIANAAAIGILGAEGLIRTGAPAVGSAAFLLMLAAANLVRVAQITRDLRLVRQLSTQADREPQ